MKTATEWYCDWFELTLADLDTGDRRIIKMMESYGNEKCKVCIHTFSDQRPTPEDYDKKP